MAKHLVKPGIAWGSLGGRTRLQLQWMDYECDSLVDAPATSEEHRRHTKITQIIVGCDAREDQDMNGKERHLTHPHGAADNVVTPEMWAKSVHPSVERIFVPSIKEAREFPWYNKPWSYKFYAEHLKKTGFSGEEIFAIIDPDEFFLTELHNRGTNRDGLICNMPERYIQDLLGRVSHPAGEALDVVRKGKGVAQTYGLGPGIVTKFDRSKICGVGGLCTKIDKEAAMFYHSTGPPYMLHSDDFLKVMPQWMEFMGPVYKQDHGDIQVCGIARSSFVVFHHPPYARQADMYAYGLAAENNGVRHMQLDQYMVSNAWSPGEGWDFVDPHYSVLSCDNPTLPAGAHRPTFIHAAGHFKACSKGDSVQHYPDNYRSKCEPGSVLWNFHKGHVPADILRCDAPLLVTPPDSIIKAQKKQADQRNAFMMCNNFFMVNRMLVNYKKRNCGADANLKKCVRLIVDRKGNTPKCKSKGNPDCYPIAQLDDACVPGQVTKVGES
eukprot:g1562.t1